MLYLFKRVIVAPLFFFLLLLSLKSAELVAWWLARLDLWSKPACLLLFAYSRISVHLICYCLLLLFLFYRSLKVRLLLLVWFRIACNDLDLSFCSFDVSPRIVLVRLIEVESTRLCRCRFPFRFLSLDRNRLLVLILFGKSSKIKNFWLRSYWLVLVIVHSFVIFKNKSLFDFLLSEDVSKRNVVHAKFKVFTTFL